MTDGQAYLFGDLPIDSAIIVQIAIVKRKETINLQQSDKAIKATLSELDQLYDDLDRHIASLVRTQKLKESAERMPQD